MTKLRTSCLVGALCVLVGCSSTTPNNDGGVDSGIDAGVDAGIDAGIDAGVDAGPMYGPLSCSGIANCVEQSANITTTVAENCAKEGTADAGIVFAPLFECAQGCASVADAGGCLGALVSTPDSDGGCETEYGNCQAQGLGCPSLLECVLTSTQTQSAIATCIGEGTATAIGLGETLLGCEQEACASDGGNSLACDESAVSPDGGVCYDDYVACASDTSANP